MSTRSAVGRVRPWWAVAVVGSAIFLTILDLFVVNLALPVMASGFPGSSLASLSWVLISYAVVFAAALMPAGKLGDVYGRRRFFLIGLALFLLGSLAAGAAPSLPLLIAARVLQALGAAAATPNSLGAVLPLFAPARRAAVISVWGALAGLGAAVGPPLGGILAQLSWRWTFLINLPIGVAALLLTPRLVPEVREASRRLPDLLGALLLGAAIAALTLGLTQGPHWGWGLRFIGCLFGCVVLVAVVAVRSTRHPAPIVEPDLLRNRTFRLALTATVLFWAGFAALLISSALFLTAVWSQPVLRAGLALTPGPALSAVVAGLAGRLSHKIGARRVAAVGGVLFAAGGVWLALRLGDTVAYPNVFLPAQLLAGAGIGLVVPTLVALSVDALPPARLSTGLAVYGAFRQIGAALGVALWVAVSGVPSRASHFQPGWWLLAGLGTATTLIMLFVQPASSIPTTAQASSPANVAR